jgi:hypothetical protein
MTKKGILLPEVLKIILAVIGIVALIYLAVSMFGLFTKKAELEQARGILTEIDAKVKALVNAGDERKVVVLSPKDWYILAYGKTGARPQMCKGENCICLCNDNEVSDCDEMGLCRDFASEMRISGGESIEIDKMFNLKLTKRADYIELTKEVSAK